MDPALQRPMRRRFAPLALTPFERELLDAPCQRHSSLAVCDECSPPRTRDSTGFPSYLHAAGRGRYRLCPSCGKLAALDEWAFAERACHHCAGRAPAKLLPPAGPARDISSRLRMAVSQRGR